MLDNWSELGQIAVDSCLTFIHLLLSFCFVAALEALGISPLP
jgi:hypothetical protein